MNALPKPLPHQLTKRLLAYATVAGASISASASRAQAEVVYTPTHNNINQDYYLDLNNDGIGDFHIHSYYLSGIGDFEVHPMIPINKVAAVDKGCPLGPGAAPLPKGAVIGPGLTLDGNATCMAFMLSWYSTGPWLGLKDRYLGFEFYIDGQKHYGWARLSMQDFFCYLCIGRIFGYAYETLPANRLSPATKAIRRSLRRSQPLSAPWRSAHPPWTCGESKTASDDRGCLIPQTARAEEPFSSLNPSEPAL